MVSLDLLLLHAAITFAMTGIIWFVHLIHYPILQVIQEQDRVVFEKLHWKKTLSLAIVMLVVELVSGISLMIWVPPGVSFSAIAFGCLLMCAIWLTTWGVCVPQHCQLKSNSSSAVAAKLMKANAIRCMLWTIRSLLVAWMLLCAMHNR